MTFLTGWKESDIHLRERFWVSGGEGCHQHPKTTLVPSHKTCTMWALLFLSFEMWYQWWLLTVTREEPINDDSQFCHSSQSIGSKGEKNNNFEDKGRRGLVKWWLWDRGVSQMMTIADKRGGGWEFPKLAYWHNMKTARPYDLTLFQWINGIHPVQTRHQEKA